MKKQRIWELDALRGLCILGMVVFHLVYDLTELYRLVQWKLPPAWTFVQDAGGVLFLLLSGLCVTLGSRPVRRGLVVFGSGMLCTLVTWGMYRLGYAGESLVIRFGVLHCLGLCMLLWPAVRKLPTPVLALLGTVLTAAGLCLSAWDVHTACKWLFPLGIPYRGFSSGDYFPLLPYAGWFLLGSVLGRTVYRKKQTLLPCRDPQRPPLPFLRLCGRHSLIIYLLHQPLLSALLSAISM